MFRRGGFNRVQAGGGGVVGDVELVKGTEEQEAVWDALLNTSSHVIVEAVAGSGKTFTLVQYALRDKQRRIGLVAFNKHIADELRVRVGGQSNVDTMTYHSLGFKAVRMHVGGRRCEVDQYKVLGILDEVMPAANTKKAEAESKLIKYRVKALVSYAKSAGLNYGASDEQLRGLVDRFDVDLSEISEAVVFEYTRLCLLECQRRLATVDYDDMVWLPYVLKLRVPKWDVLCVDEYQDTGLTQQWLAVEAGVRLCAVGDPNQAIYAFRGADSEGFDRLRTRLGAGVVTLPLTLTRRCPKIHVRLAQGIVPAIRAMEDAPEGVVRVVKTVDMAVAEMKAGDLVLCRVNAELVGVAYKLLKRGVRAVVRGRDLGEGLKRFVEECAKGVEDGKDVKALIARAGQITEDQTRKFLAMPNGKGETRAMNAQDRYECLVNLAGQCEGIREVVDVIGRLFDDTEGLSRAVVLGTVHRTKGLEGKRVYVLRPDLIPHPMARKKQDQQGERNLAYVAVTRAKFTADSHEFTPSAITGDCKCGDRKVSSSHESGELVWVGGECSLFPLLPGMDKAGDELQKSMLLVDEDPFGINGMEEAVVDGVDVEYESRLTNEIEQDWDN